MPKNIDDMIVPERRRTIRDIPIPESRRRNEKHLDSFTTPDYIPQTPPPAPSSYSRPPRIRRKGIWIATGLALIVLVFAVLSIFNGATLAYVPKSAALNFSDDIYTARKTGDSGLLYSVVKLSGEKGAEATASGESEVSRKASGTIVIYNNASAEPQRLIATTRFETPNGLVYRIDKDITIPGRKTPSGVTEPGSIEAVVYADQAGDKYNVGLSDFTLPGLKGTPRYSTIYARSKTEMAGGFVGVERVVSEADRSQVEVALKEALREQLTSEARAQVPEDFILFPTLSFIAYESLPQTASATAGKAIINLRGNLYGVMFKKSDLSTHLATEKLSLESAEPVDIENLESLDLSFLSANPPDLLNTDEIRFSVTGDTFAIWHTDEVALKADLVGKNKRDQPTILNNYPTVVSATATIRPFWKGSFPSDTTDLSVKMLPVE